MLMDPVPGPVTMRRKRGRARSNASNPDAETNGLMCEYLIPNALPLTSFSLFIVCMAS